MNEHDTQKILLILSKIGYTRTDKPQSADLIIYNTCTIREKAYHKAESEIGRAHLFKKEKRGQIIAVCGCVAQQEGANLFVRFPHVDIIFGPDQINELPNLLERFNSPSNSSFRLEDSIVGRKTAIAIDLINDIDKYNFISDIPSHIESGHAFVTISKGCNCLCTYCIVPFVRGSEVSRPSREIIDEVNALVLAGIKEVTLLGQNVTSYKNNGLSLAGLISLLSKETDIRRIRFMSPHPKDVDDFLIEEYARNERLCPHIHLPAQSGSNRILKKMGRGYTREVYLDIVARLRKARPDISVTSDFIAGFCGETEYDFNQTMELLREVLFDSIFAFRYSIRPKTIASLKFADDVPFRVKEERLTKILSFQREVTLMKNKARVGKTYEVLVTGLDRKKSGRLMGRLPDNRIVNFTGNPSMIGSTVSVRIIKGLANSLEGEYLNG